MNHTDLLSGQFQLRPGTERPIVGQRGVLGGGRLGHLLRGQSGAQVGASLTSLFSLCAHAHRRTADMAQALARPGAQQTPATDPTVLLWLETARDHLRSIALDWPQRLPERSAAAQNLDWLRDCPLHLVVNRAHTDDAADAWETLAELRTWLERRVLLQPISDWLPSHRDPEALALWCSAQAPRLLPARCLAQGYPMARSLTPPTRCLDVLDADLALQSAQLRELARSLVHEREFAQRPTWLGECAESGPWTRLRHRRDRAQAQPSAWTRLAARWMELMEIAAADPSALSQGQVPLLSCGALALAEGQALAWCEMARGLLLHWVQLDARGAVQDYRVLAPTEWNFHPEGALARALSALPPGATLAAQTLAAAFDPCVVCTVQPAATGNSA